MDKNFKRVDELMETLNEIYPDPKCELNYDNPFQLLVATVLAAQATDKGVNKATAELFKVCKTPEDLLKLSEEELYQYIKSINYYRTKGKHLFGICRELIDKYEGEVPAKLEELVKLPGVGRKTANVVLSNAFHIPAIAVDTHVHRVSNKLGLVATKNVEDTELGLQRLIPKAQWSKAHNYLVLHGRYVCNAKKPKCELCQLNYLCKYFNSDNRT